MALQGGWGPGFCAHLIASAQCLDLAANGRSTKSFIDEGLWAKALEAHGQFYFIQFGHNDQKHRPALFTDPQTTFQANLDRFVRDVRRIGGKPALVTSLSRRNYRNEMLIVDPLRDYAAATRQVAAKDHVPLIDLYRLSRALLKPMTQQQADHYDANTLDGVAAPKPDRTHLNTLGKTTFGDMVAHAAWQNVPQLRPYIFFRAAEKHTSSRVPLQPSTPATNTHFPVATAMM
ncbi:MAG: rhamnogalacturonan acetylesterase [Terracidiphilus sp.]